MVVPFGVVVYLAWFSSALWLIIPSPVVWLLGRRRLLMIHSTFLGCHAAIFFAVSRYTWFPPGKDHDFYYTLARHDLDIPVVVVDLIILARLSSQKARVLMRDSVIVITLAICTFYISSWAVPFWLHSITPTILARARSIVKERPFCIDVGLKGREKQLAHLQTDDLFNAFAGGGGIEYYGYYDVLKIDGVQSDQNWSFQTGNFEPASPYFRARCEPVAGGRLQ